MPCCAAAGSTGFPTSTGKPICRYEHDCPGSLVHVDVKKLGNIPDGGGWRYLGREQGKKTGTQPPERRASQAASTAAR